MTFFLHPLDSSFARMMGFLEELYSQMLEVSLAARHHEIPSGRVLIDIAQSLLELWWQDEKSAICFAGVTNLQVMIGQLPEPMALACSRLISLLEYLADLHHE